MSTSAQTLPLSIPAFPQYSGQQPRPKRAPERRRTNEQQGQALEILGHAIEYLVDSRLYEQWETPSDATAVHLLMSCSRAVFSECDVVHPWHQRVQRALLKTLRFDGAASRDGSRAW
jgi:hypothetical protein